MKNKKQTFSFDEKMGLVIGARYVPSPNFDQRPIDMPAEAIIIHAISLPPSQYGGDYVEQFFCNQLNPNEHSYFSEISDCQVSSHFYIRRNGDLVQFVPVHQRAWHAGVSHCMGRDAVNDFSIGIELEGCDEDVFKTEQYQTLVLLTESLVSSIPSLSTEHIYGHEDISPGRKTDPGPGFDWQAYRQALSNSRI